MYIKPLRGASLNPFHLLARGLVGCWLLNEGCGNKAYDLSGHNNHGTLKDMAFPPTTTSGWNPSKDGIGLNFDGSNDYVDCGNDPSLNITDAITIETWVKPDRIDRDWDSMIDKYAGGVNWAYLLGFTDVDGEIRFRIGTDSARSIATLEVGKWYHLVGTYDKTTELIKLFVNGAFDSQIAHTGDIPIAGNDLIIGKTLFSVGREYDGSIDGVKIYNRALSAFEIQQLGIEPYAMFEPVGISGMLYNEIDIVPDSNLAIMQVLMR